jgi:hypothetical protein
MKELKKERIEERKELKKERIDKHINLFNSKIIREDVVPVVS